ncbi:unnamed protein product [Urochloa decumbens]|uniref:Uncharacterized protein n=1 Tax=Urochloa decumbens TaxID=240449 RepID=A0ABC9BAS8_9POAL
MPSASKKTASRCTTEAARGTHLLEIVGYSHKRGLGVGKFVRSRTFTVGGYDWAMCFYPDGLNESSQEYVSIYLELMSENAEARAFYSLNDYVRDDCLAIECNLVVAKEAHVSDIVVDSEIEVPPCDIPEHFAKLLDHNDGADVTFSVQGEIIKAHKTILAARSPVFKAQFYGQMRESRMGHVTVEDIQPVIFRALLRFIYTGSLHGMGDDLVGDDYRDTLWHLLAAADRYAMDRLKLLCQSILSKNFHVETVAATLALADQHNCDKLKEVCIEFITTGDMNAVVATQGYANLKRVALLS